MSLGKFRTFAVLVGLSIFVLAGCGRGVITINLYDRSFVNFNELAVFSFYDGHIQLYGELEPFSRGQAATISVIGIPYTEYNLSVILASGPSQASGLGGASSDSAGHVSWTWNVAHQTRPGRFSAVITGPGDMLVLDITIE